MVTLSKEVRNLKWLGFRIPLVVSNKAKEAAHLYPLAMALRGCVRSYSHIVQRLNQYPKLQSLVSPFHRAVQHRLTEGAALRFVD
jgi:dynein heavy chain 1